MSLPWTIEPEHPLPSMFFSVKFVYPALAKPESRWARRRMLWWVSLGLVLLAGEMRLQDKHKKQRIKCQRKDNYSLATRRISSSFLLIIKSFKSYLNCWTYFLWAEVKNPLLTGTWWFFLQPVWHHVPFGGNARSITLFPPPCPHRPYALHFLSGQCRVLF